MPPKSNPYQKYQNKASVKGIPRKPESLSRGVKYTVVAIEKKESIYKDKDGNKVYNMLAHYMDKGIKFISYLPSNYKNPEDEDIEMFNKDITDKKPGFVVFYGTIGSSKQFEFLPFGSDVDEEKLKTVAAIEEEEKLAKVSGQSDSFEESPTKRFKKD